MRHHTRHLRQIEEEQTKPEQNVTSFGVRLNLKGYIDGLLDLARYWHDENQKKISLRDFMVNPDSEIRVLFIKPNDSERLMSSGIIRSALNYMISLLDTPAITDSSDVRGAFILDEFQAPGKLVTEDGKPTIDKLLDRGRSKGFAACIFAQDATQLYGEYSENDVKKWRQVASGFVLTGTAPGDTADMVSNMIGKRFFLTNSTAPSGTQSKASPVLAMHPFSSTTSRQSYLLSSLPTSPQKTAISTTST